MNRKALLRKISRGNLNNVSFGDFINLVEGVGFKLRAIKGSHHTFTHNNVPGFLNLQPLKGEANPYQIRQFQKIFDKYELFLED